MEIYKVGYRENDAYTSYLDMGKPARLNKQQVEKLKSKKYILYVGDRKGYKNFDITINVFQKLNDFIFVIVGGGDLIDDEKELLKKECFHYQGISTKDLNILYNNAFCLLYPSSYEGFGIPILEAMKAGCPVVSTNISSIPEVAGDAGLLVDKVEVKEFVKTILKLENKE